MNYSDIILATPEENLACDEALIEFCEAAPGKEILRVWHPERHFVVLGCSNRQATEVNVEACRELGIPILRRMSGGGAILQGPGCLNYALVLHRRSEAFLHNITAAYAHVMERHRRLFQSLLERRVTIEGVSDLAVDGKKFSGNSQYRRRHYVLLHGTVLLDIDIGLIEKCLFMPSRHPAYRELRSHAQFLTNVPLPVSTVAASLREAWNAVEDTRQIPRPLIDGLVKAKYGNPGWNHRR